MESICTIHSCHIRPFPAIILRAVRNETGSRAPLHQVNSDQQILDLNPPTEDRVGDRAGTSIDDVLEYARQRSAERELAEYSERRLPNLAPAERWWARWMWLIIALAVAWAHFHVVRSFWAPANGGVDQNGYQVGGKMFSQSFSTGFKPPNPYSYVGWMWVASPNGWVYPKYPLGVPMLDAM